MYRSFHETMKSRFGCKVYKLALDGGMTCPNRDGTIGSRGCIFCGEKGGGEFAAPACADVWKQIETAKKRVEKKVGNGKYIAYFQSFTNTYAPVKHLHGIFSRAIAHPDVVALSVATRPDCLPAETVGLLEELNHYKPVWVELGLQTMHPQTAAYLRRGYDLACYEEALTRLKAAGLEVIVHMILGLPRETPEMMVETAAYIGAGGADGIKLQLLHVLEDTDLAADYRAGKLDTLDLEAYIAILEACVEALPPEVVIHRLTGDGAKEKLLAPLWSGDKKRVLNRINKRFQEDHVEQGRNWPLYRIRNFA